MRTPGLIVAALLFAASPAMAQSHWLEKGRLGASEIAALCGRASDIRSLALNQMITTGDKRWRRLSRQQLAVEAFVMGQPPFDPERCYIVVRAGLGDDTERRAFEVLDFAVNAERTSVFVIGHNFELPLEGAELSRPRR